MSWGEARARKGGSRRLLSNALRALRLQPLPFAIGEERITSHPPFWDERYATHEALFGTAPNAFVREQGARIPRGSRVAEVGAGEGRNLIYLARKRAARVTAVDFAAAGLRAASKRAEAAGVTLETIAADARTWRPGEPFDAVVVTFLHLLPGERPASYRCLRDALRPGGVLVAEWFATRHADKTRFVPVGPSKADRLLAASELRVHFPALGIEELGVVERTLDEGPMLKGRAAVLRFVWRKPEP